MRGFTQQDIELVNWIFSELQSIKPAWRQSFPTDESLKAAKRTWTVGLVENDITDTEAIKIALRAARASETAYFPSIGQFISWCGVRKELKAREAFNHLNVYLAGDADKLPLEIRAAFDQIRRTDFQSRESDLYPVFKRHYEQILNLKLAGQPIEQFLLRTTKDAGSQGSINEQTRLSVLDKIQKFKAENFGG